jgi:hypothetical protein
VPDLASPTDTIETDDAPETPQAVAKKARLVPAKDDGEDKVRSAVEDLFEKAYKARTLWDPWWTRYVAFTEGQ